MTYCLKCKKDTEKVYSKMLKTKNVGSKKVTMKNKVTREKSRCANCISDKSRFLKQKPNKKDWNKTNPKLFIY